jgi:hypothetical protein
MLEKLPVITTQIGGSDVTNNTPPLPSSGKASNETEQIKAAKQAVSRLFEWCLPPDAGNAEVYLAGAIGILAEYPLEVMEKISNPISGSKELPDRPTLRKLREACECLYGPLRRQAERDAAHADHQWLASLERPRRKLTDEERIRRAAQCADLRKKLAETLLPEPSRHPGDARRQRIGNETRPTQANSAEITLQLINANSQISRLPANGAGRYKMRESSDALVGQTAAAYIIRRFGHVVAQLVSSRSARRV